ncbi:hypothetical protein QFC22_006143 [Naganishia vaughanmartiniae]|uniref:Uncharacterized protein n=1 Tax=Naganishia vaughanmartiniae TaxID=1424756 RepID=A0ACC2WN32_9TREE|nr:hypothetical protein QFC22_006143 [Naganishia vaughanmartiniae]
MKFTLSNFIRSQYTTVPQVVCPDLTGRVVIVTGSNTGLGYEAAKTFAQHNPSRLILAVRNTHAGHKAAQEIVEANGGKGTVPEVWELDLGRLQSVKDFGDCVNRELERLDVFVSNAGISTEKFVKTVDGFESTKTAHLPPMPHSPNFKPHLTIVSSAVHYWIHDVLPGMKEGRKDTLQCFQEEELFKPSDRYNETKAVNIMNAFILADLLCPDIIVNAVHPGLCHSSLMRESVGLKGCLIGLLKLIAARSTEAGARNLVWAGTHDMPTGAYIHDCRVFEPSDFVLSTQGREIGAEIWDEMKVIWKEKVGVDADAIVQASS